MKKILVIAMLALFSVSAFALDATFKGESELRGTMTSNGSLSGDSKDTTKSNFYQKLRIWSTINIENVVTLDLRATPFDGYIWGRDDADGITKNGNVRLDRAYVTFNFEPIVVSAGVLTAGEYYSVLFGTVNHKEADAGLTKANGIRVKYLMNDAMNVQFEYLKTNENQSGSNIFTQSRNLDNTNYIVAGDMTFGNLRVTPSLGYNDINLDKKGNQLKDSYRITGQLSAVYTEGNIQAKAAMAFDSKTQKDANGVKDESQSNTVLGMYIDGAYVTGEMSAGALFAIGSAGNNKRAFYFGDDFGSTVIVDGQYFDGTGAGGLWTLQAYGSYRIMPELNLLGKIAYYGSVANKGLENRVNGTLVAINDKSKIVEVDLRADYTLTKSTTVSAIAAYAMNSDVDRLAQTDDNGKVTVNGEEDIDDVFMLRWQVKTLF